MKRFLDTMEYPCTSDDLLREAVQAGEDVLTEIRRIPRRTYHGAREVRIALEGLND